MIRTTTLGAVAVVVLLAAGATADDKAVAAIQKQEAAATQKCAAELVKCAKALVALKAFDEAREELRSAMTVAPLDVNCRKEFAKIMATKGDTPDAVSDKVTQTRDAAHAACVATLLPVLQAWGQAERPEDLAHLATPTVACFGAVDALKALELVWYEPFLAWARKKDVDRWEKGDEFIDGAWADAEKVKTLDAAHSNWKTPWIVGDGIHEVRTAMPLRAAKRMIEYVRNWRRFVIDFFAGEWEWKQSKAPLPIYVTATQAEYQDRLREYDPNATKSQASALYVQKTGGICPVFVTFEPKVAGAGTKIDWTALLRDVRHETTHQILYESAMAQGAAVGGNIDWVSEGVANFIACHRPHEGRWKLARAEQEPYANGFEPGPFAWARGNFDRIPPLAKYFTEFKPNLDAVEDYFIATTLCYFLLNDPERRYRASMVKLLVEVHTAKGGPKSFAECFGKVDFAKMQDEWKQFVDGISIQPK